jgi:acetyltransferase-like isoleucine patch superfamily enzyme
MARLQLMGCALGRGVRTSGRVIAEGRSRIWIGDRSGFLGGLVPTRLIAHSGAALRVGAGCTFNYGAHVEAYALIEIGSDCMFGTAVVICDRDDDRAAPIIIEDGVWVAHGARVRPGVRIGHGAVVSAGSVVSEDVPHDMMAVGNPARSLPLSLVAGHPDSESQT